MPFSLPLDAYKAKSVLAIGLSEAAVLAITKEASFCTVFDYSAEVTEKFKNLFTACRLEAYNVDIRQPLPPLNQHYDLIISNLIPAEEEAKKRLLSRLKPFLHDNGRLFITRPAFEESFGKNELPDITNDSGFILTSTLHPEPPIKGAKIIITALSDPYPMNERFLAAIITSLAQKEELLLTWDTVCGDAEVTLTATGDYTITLSVNKELMTFKATIEPASGNILNTLSNLALVTFCNDVKEHHISQKDGYLLTEVTAG